ncbi:Hypothetical protein ETEE_4156 [Edwardsiella anguillarum ET080813]|uniref:Uncharacterized protein n=1 Tax=Edwardsiella anguillarum ET080813 TaxID=667120 RepID=A0A076LRH5_9GAMM|nr:Hypothetical protein ETEE_4156 [Edwardsiella anguillarum ET080813]
MAQKAVQPVSADAEYTSKKSEITPLKCDGINRVYHETMVKALRMEINKLQDIIHNHQLTSP